MTTKAIEAGARAIREHRNSSREGQAQACIESAIASGELVPASATKPWSSSEFLTSTEALDEYVKERVASAVASERERCANVAERAAERDAAWAVKYPDEARRCEERELRATTIAAAIRAMPKIEDQT